MSLTPSAFRPTVLRPRYHRSMVSPVSYRHAFAPGPAFKPLKTPKGFRGMMTGQMIMGRPTAMPGLHPAKYGSRRALSQGMRKATILHLYAGRGNLARAVYKNKAAHHILVDRRVNPALKSQLNGRVSVYEKNVDRFLEEDLPKIKEDIALVDMDPFGTPAQSLKSFFKHYHPRQQLRVGVTDGYALFLGLAKHRREGEESVRRLYRSANPGDASATNQVRLLDNLMKSLGRQHGLRVQRVNVSKNEARTVYAGYVLSPSQS